MSEVSVTLTPKDFAPPAFIDRMRSSSLVVGIVFSVLALGAYAGPEQWDCFCAHGCFPSCSGWA